MRGSLMPLGVLLVSSTWRLFLPAVTGKESVIRRMKSVRELKAVKELSSSYNSKVCEENTVINSLIITSQGGWVDSLNKAAGNWGILGNLLRILQIFITGKTSIKSMLRGSRTSNSSETVALKVYSTLWDKMCTWCHWTAHLWLTLVYVCSFSSSWGRGSWP